VNSARTAISFFLPLLAMLGGCAAEEAREGELLGFEGRFESEFEGGPVSPVNANERPPEGETDQGAAGAAQSGSGVDVEPLGEEAVTGDEEGGVKEEFWVVGSPLDFGNGLKWRLFIQNFSAEEFEYDSEEVEVNSPEPEFRFCLRGRAEMTLPYETINCIECNPGYECDDLSIQVPDESYLKNPLQFLVLDRDPTEDEEVARFTWWTMETGANVAGFVATEEQVFSVSKPNNLALKFIMQIENL